MKILVSALEKSSNLHLKELTKYLKGCELVGIFDKELGTPLADLQSLAVMGFVEAVKKLPLFFELKREMVSLAKNCDTVLLMDSSGFNLPLAKSIKKLYPKKRIVYYILPQAWAWRRGRIKDLTKYCDRLCSILPFEKKFYPPNAPIEYVGNPLMEEIERFKNKPAKSGKIAFLPGSRPGEIKRLIKIFKETREKIDKEALLVVPPHFSEEDIKNIYGEIDSFTLRRDATQALYESEFAFVCSGTATLESSLIGTPLALAYVASPVDYFVAKSLIDLRYVGLANIIYEDALNQTIHPEFIQNEVSSKNLIEAFNESDPDEFIQKSKKLRGLLKGGCSPRVAQIVKGEE